MPITITTRVEDALVHDIDFIASKESSDRSSVIRKFLVESLKEWKLQQSLEAYEQGKITLWQAAKKCGMSLWEMVEEVKKRKVRIPYTLEALREDIQAL